MCVCTLGNPRIEPLLTLWARHQHNSIGLNYHALAHYVWQRHIKFEQGTTAVLVGSYVE